MDTAQPYSRIDGPSSPSRPAGSRSAATDQNVVVDLFGLPFLSAKDEDAVVAELLDWKPQDFVPPFLVTPNVDIVVRLFEADGCHHFTSFETALWVLPDGWPIVKVSEIAGKPLQARLAGSTVFAKWWPKVVEEDRPVALAVSSRETASALLAEHASASIVVPDFIEGTAEGVRPIAAELVDRALEIGAEYVVTGIGYPKDLLMAEEFRRLWPKDEPAPLVMCLGAAAELYIGIRKRAPEWAQRMGCEWLYRFAQEPQRMFRRYFVRDPKFLPLAAREIRRSRSGGRDD